MILWLILFILVIVLSFILAAKSMWDFQEIPSQEKYSLFLIRKPQNLNKELLSSLHDNFLKSGWFLSFERLFKGNKSALVVFGPSGILKTYPSLDLLELEDYTAVNAEEVSAWEVGRGKGEPFDGVYPERSRGAGGKDIFVKLPQLAQSEQFWWQVVVSDQFRVQIRAVAVSTDSVKRASIGDILQLASSAQSAQIIEIYQKRIFRKDENNPRLTAEEVLKLFII